MRKRVRGRTLCRVAVDKAYLFMKSLTAEVVALLRFLEQSLQALVQIVLFVLKDVVWIVNLFWRMNSGRKSSPLYSYVHFALISLRL